MIRSKRNAVTFLIFILALNIVLVPFTPLVEVTSKTSTQRMATPDDVKYDLEKYLNNRNHDGPLDSVLAAYKETGVVPNNVATNNDGAMGVLLTIGNEYDTTSLDDIIDINWKVDFGTATIVSAYIDSVDEIIVIESYDGVITAFADGLYKEKSSNIEQKPIFEQNPIATEPMAYDTTAEIGSDQVNLAGITGDDVRVGVIDSGTDFSIPDLVDAIDFGTDGLPTSYDPSGYGVGLTLYRVNLTPVEPAAWLSYSSWNMLSFEEDGHYYIDTSTYQHNGGSPYLNNQGALSDLDFYVDAYLSAWWDDAYPNQANLTDFYYNVMRQPLEIPNPSTISGGDTLSITVGEETQIVPYACQGYIFQQRWDPYMKVFSPVLVVNNTKIIVDWNTTRAWTDFWNLNINLGEWNFNTTAAWDYYNTLGDWSFVDDLTAGEYYTPDGTVAHTNIYHDYLDGTRFGLGILGHCWEGTIFDLGMIDGIGLGGRVVGVLYDSASHGTFVASQIASRGQTQYPVGLNGSLEYLPGVAPNSTIMSIMTVGITSEFSSMLWVAGFDFNDISGYFEWNATSSHQMDITSNSWGWNATQYYDLRGQFSLIYAALATPGFFDVDYPGMIQCFSAGDSGPGYGTSIPLRVPQIINVGASTNYHTLENLYGPEQGSGQIADFSARGPLILGYGKPDVLAPGRDNWGLVPSYGSAFMIPDSSLGYATRSGTSIACSLVAGIAALLVEAYLNEYSVKATPDMIKTIIQNTADDIGMDGLSQGRGIVNAWAAYDYVHNGNGNLFYTYDSVENWAAATVEAWQYQMNPYNLETYFESTIPPTNFVDGNLYFGLVSPSDSVTMTIEGDFGVYSDWSWEGTEYVVDSVTRFPFETWIYNETTSTSENSIKAGYFSFANELGANYTSFLNAQYATIYITGDQTTFVNNDMSAFIFNWEDNDPANGIPDYYNPLAGVGDELTCIQSAGNTGNVLKIDLSNPGGLNAIFQNNGIVAIRDNNIWNWPYTGGNTLEITVVTWILVNDPTISFSDNSGNCDVTLTVPSGATYGIHQGLLNISGFGGLYKIPYTYNVYATYDTEGTVLTLADGIETVWKPYEPGVIATGCDSFYTERSADQYSFVVDVTDSTITTLSVRINWINPSTNIEIALIDITGHELASSFDSIKITNTSALIIAEVSDAGKYMIHTTVTAIEGTVLPEAFVLTFMGFHELEEPTLNIGWYSRDHPTMTEFTSGASFGGDHVIVNATWVDVDIPEIPEWKIASTSMHVFYGTIFTETGPVVHPSDPSGQYVGRIDPDDFAWVIVPDLHEGDTARITLDFEGSDLDAMMWPATIPMQEWSFYNNILHGDMATGSKPEFATAIIPENGDYMVGILDYGGDGSTYTLTVDTRISFVDSNEKSNSVELDTYYIMENMTVSIFVTGVTGTNFELHVEITDVFIGNFIAPEVTVYTPIPVPGDEARTFDVTWSVTDLNIGDEHYFSLWLSNDDGISYMLLIQNLTTTTYRWNSSGWTYGTYIFRVRAYSLDFTNFEQDLSNVPSGYHPGDFSDGFSIPFVAGEPQIVDTIPPIINAQSDIQYTESSTGHFLSWTPYDLHPFSYAIFLDNVIIQSESWNSSSETITISVDGLSIGIHNVTIVVFDTSGNSAFDTVLVTVIAASSSTTTIVSTTTTTTTTSYNTSANQENLSLIIVVAAGAAAGLVIIVILFVLPKKQNPQGT